MERNQWLNSVERLSKLSNEKTALEAQLKEVNGLRERYIIEVCQGYVKLKEKGDKTAQDDKLMESFSLKHIKDEDSAGTFE